MRFYSRVMSSRTKPDRARHRIDLFMPILPTKIYTVRIEFLFVKEIFFYHAYQWRQCFPACRVAMEGASMSKAARGSPGLDLPVSKSPAASGSRASRPSRGSSGSGVRSRDAVTGTGAATARWRRCASAHRPTEQPVAACSALHRRGPSMPTCCPRQPRGTGSTRGSWWSWAAAQFKGVLWARKEEARSCGRPHGSCLVRPVG
jgi:hypothetical protein